MLQGYIILDLFLFFIFPGLYTVSEQIHYQNCNYNSSSLLQMNKNIQKL